MRSGQQPCDPGQPLVELGQRHLAVGRFVLRGRPGLAGTVGDETRCHLRGDHRQREQPGAHDEARVTGAYMVISGTLRLLS